MARLRNQCYNWDLNLVPTSMKCSQCRHVIATQNGTEDEEKPAYMWQWLGLVETTQEATYASLQIITRLHKVQSINWCCARLERKAFVSHTHPTASTKSCLHTQLF